MTLENLEDPIPTEVPCDAGILLDITMNDEDPGHPEPLDRDHDFPEPEEPGCPPTPPPVADASHPTDDIDKAAPTIGERLVGSSSSTAVAITELRGARTVDLLLNAPLNIVTGPNGVPTFDMHHRMLIEEAVRRQIEASMWAVKALTWKG